MMPDFLVLLSDWSRDIAIVLITIIITVTVGYVFYRLSFQEATPVFYSKSIVIINGGIRDLSDEIEVLYSGNKVDKLTKTVVIFWNAGKKILEGKEIVTTEPIRFIFAASGNYNHGKVLRASVLEQSRKTNNFLLEIKEEGLNEVHLKFSYLEPGDGAIFEFLHTADKITPEVKGSIKGVPKGVVLNNLSGFYRNTPFLYRLSLVFTMIVAPVILIVTTGLYIISTEPTTDHLLSIPILIVAAAFSFYVVVSFSSKYIIGKFKKPTNLNIDKYF